MISCDACKTTGEYEPHLGYGWTVTDQRLNALGFNHLCGCCNHVYHTTKAYRGETAAEEYLEGLRRIGENKVSV